MFPQSAECVYVFLFVFYLVLFHTYIKIPSKKIYIHKEEALSKQQQQLDLEGDWTILLAVTLKVNSSDFSLLVERITLVALHPVTSRWIFSLSLAEASASFLFIVPF